MNHISRTVVTLSLLSLLAPGFNRLARSQAPASPEVSKKTFIISGDTGVPVAVLKGLPGRAISDADGRYQVTVEYGWSGTVTPAKEGYAFTPANRTYNAVSKNCGNDDYTAEFLTFTISGGLGIPGVIMTGLPGHVVTDAHGGYVATVSYGWSGRVVPVKKGCEFEPPSREYSRVTEDRRTDGYQPRMFTFTISDTIAVGDEPIEGVRVTGQPGGESTLTDADGRYSMNVPYGWTGKLTFAKDGFEFDPPSISYSSVTSDIIDGKPVPPGTATTVRQPRTTGQFRRAAAAESGGNVLVVPTKEVTPEQFTQTAEDMRVMLNILREKLSEPRTIRGVLYDYGDFFGDTGRAVEALYLQGYAAIFMLKADFPLSLPTQQGQAEMQKTEPADPVWQRARDRLYSPQNTSPYGPGGMPREADQKSLDQLKEDLVKALKHAANIRNIDPNEWVILTVTERSGASSSGGFGGGMYGMGMMGGMGYGGMMSGSGGGGSFNYGSGGNFRMDSSVGASSRMRGPASRAPQAPAAPASTTALTIQAKKGDIDAFSKGTLSLEQFQQKVKVFTY